MNRSGERRSKREEKRGGKQRRKIKKNGMKVIGKKKIQSSNDIK